MTRLPTRGVAASIKLAVPRLTRAPPFPLGKRRCHIACHMIWQCENLRKICVLCPCCSPQDVVDFGKIAHSLHRDRSRAENGGCSCCLPKPGACHCQLNAQSHPLGCSGVGLRSSGAGPDRPATIAPTFPTRLLRLS